MCYITIGYWCTGSPKRFLPGDKSPRALRKVAGEVTVSSAMCRSSIRGRYEAAPVFYQKSTGPVARHRRVMRGGAGMMPKYNWSTVPVNDSHRALPYHPLTLPRNMLYILAWPTRPNTNKGAEMKHTPSQKVIAAIVANGAGAVNIRQAVKAGLTVRQFKQALKLHAQVSR